MKIGVITYDCAHLKTEQIVRKYVNDKRIFEIRLFALPFLPRRVRHPMVKHRPDMQRSLRTEHLENENKVSFSRWDGEQKISDQCDIFVIGGSGILNPNFAEGKPIINAHPGIIPTTRGLDSFKWAIFFGDPVGVTLHEIDENVDGGEILAIRHTPVFPDDSIETLAKRHYDSEIELLADVISYIDKREHPEAAAKEAKLRMTASVEIEMLQRFDCWKKKMIIR
jgi:phosphoribosylglycinamide formyltransferase-1